MQHLHKIASRRLRTVGQLSVTAVLPRYSPAASYVQLRAHSTRGPFSESPKEENAQSHKKQDPVLSGLITARLGQFEVNEGINRVANQLNRGLDDFIMLAKGKGPSKKKAEEEEEEDNNNDNNDNDDDPKKNFFQKYMWHLILGGGAVLFLVLPNFSAANYKHPQEETSWQSFKETLLGTTQVDRLVVVNEQFVDVYTHSPVVPAYWFTINNTHEFEEKLVKSYEEKGVPPSRWHNVKHVHLMEPTSVLQFLPTLLYLGVILAIFQSARGGGRGGGMNNPFNMTKMKSATVQKDIKVGFTDVAGMQEAKEEIMEFVSFLKDPSRYTRVGAKVPNGAMLMGPPGTGKTLLAKAVAGESGVPFLSVSGSDFVEMFVGVGPGRIRSLFKQARKHDRCIIYIDEIDAIARPRGKGVTSGSNDERENTLNALLVEMDGFDKDQGKVIVLASTNVSSDQLDPALMRPGRFDRQINVEKPEVSERMQIFKLHLSKLALQDRAEMDEVERVRNERLTQEGKVDILHNIKRADPTEEELKNLMPGGVDTTNDLLVIHRFAERMAHLTPGFVGADIANVCNEGALMSARDGATKVSLDHLEKAIDRVIGGIERRSRVLSDFEKKVVAYHEAGHAIVGWFLKYADPLMKISIIPRGSAALGYAQYLPKETNISTAEQLTDRMCCLLGGRVSELIHFGHLSTGASDDLRKITQIAYTQVSQFGMYEGGGHVSFPAPGQSGELVKPYSEEVAEVFDVEVKKLIDAAFEKTKQLLQDKDKEVKLVAEYLLKNEVVTRDDFIKLVGPRPFEDAPGTHPNDDQV